nr:putative FBD-associated F-box protein At5g22720 [Setaria viridis]
METVARSKRRSLEEEEMEEKEPTDRISRLPDAVLGDIVTLLPSRDGARTQVLSSRWRHIWRSAPLNLDLVRFTSFKYYGRCVREILTASEITSILSAHRGPGRRFCTKLQNLDLHGGRPAAVLDGWLRSPALDNLEELEFHYGYRYPRGFSPLPASVQRFPSTLRVAKFAGCSFPEGNAGALHLPVLKQLSLMHATISESSLQALLAGCPALQSLLLSDNSGYSRVRIMSRTLLSIGVFPGPPDDWLQRLTGGRLQHLILEDAPCLERLLIFPSAFGYAKMMDISVISAPKLNILGPISDDLSTVEFGTTVFQRPHLVSFMTVAPSVKILALLNMQISLDVVINFMKCFPCLEKLYIKIVLAGCKNWWSPEYQNFVRTHDIRLKKVVLLNYRGNSSHVNFAKFFVLNANVLESMVLELEEGITLSTEWIEKQHEHLHTNYRASSGAQFDFVYHEGRSGLIARVDEAQAHDLSTADPFVGFRAWSNI